MSRTGGGRSEPLAQKLGLWKATIRACPFLQPPFRRLVVPYTDGPLQVLDPGKRCRAAVSNSSRAVGTSSAPVIQRLTQEDSGST
jgi:hypothetical protein